MTNVVFASFYTSYLNTVAKYVHWNSNFQGTQKVRLLNKSLPRILLARHSYFKMTPSQRMVFKIYDERVVHYTISCIIGLVGWWNEDFKSLEASSWSFLEMQVLLWRRYASKWVMTRLTSFFIMMIIEWVFPFFFIIDARSYPNYRGRISPSSLDASANFKTIFHIVFGNSETTFLPPCHNGKKWARKSHFETRI